MSAASTLPLVSLRRDGGTQVRAEMNRETVDAYAEALAEGVTFPPVVVFFDGKDHWLADGFHRVLAHEKAGLTDILADVRDGSKRDALLFAVGANATHGLARTNKDKRRAVEILLRDEEWAGKSDSWIAERAAVDHKTVTRVRADLGIPKSAERTGKDGRTINTAGIGKAKSVQSVDETPPAPEPTAPTEAKAKAPTHPVLAEIEQATDLAALDRAFNKVAGAGLSEADATTAGDIYRRKAMGFRKRAGEVDAVALVKRLADAVESMTYEQNETVMDSIIAAHTSKTITQDQWAALDKAWWEKFNAIRREMAVPAPAPAPAPAPPRQADLFSQPPAPTPPPATDTVTVSKAEWDALQAEVAGLRRWQESIAARAGAGDATAVAKVMRLVGLTRSDNEHESTIAARKACQFIVDRGLIVGTSQSAIEDAELFEARRARDAAWAELQRELSAKRGAL